MAATKSWIDGDILFDAPLQLPRLDDPPGEVFVSGEGERFETMGVGEMSYIVEERRCEKRLYPVEGHRGCVAMLDEAGENTTRQVEYPKTMVEPRMGSPGVHEIRWTQLFDPAQLLKLSRVDELEYRRRKINVSPERIADRSGILRLEVTRYSVMRCHRPFPPRCVALLTWAYYHCHVVRDRPARRRQNLTVSVLAATTAVVLGVAVVLAAFRSKEDNPDADGGPRNGVAEAELGVDDEAASGEEGSSQSLSVPMGRGESSDRTHGAEPMEDSTESDRPSLWMGRAGGGIAGCGGRRSAMGDISLPADRRRACGGGPRWIAPRRLGGTGVSAAARGSEYGYRPDLSTRYRVVDDESGNRRDRNPDRGKTEGDSDRGTPGRTCRYGAVQVAYRRNDHADESTWVTHLVLAGSEAVWWNVWIYVDRGEMIDLDTLWSPKTRRDTDQLSRLESRYLIVMYYLLVEAAGIRQASRIRHEWCDRFLSEVKSVLRDHGFELTKAENELFLFREGTASTMEPEAVTEAARSAVEQLRRFADDIVDFVVLVDYLVSDPVDEAFSRMAALLRYVRDHGTAYCTDRVIAALGAADQDREERIVISDRRVPG